jgi:branched-subunit amino acid transport protein
VSTGATVIAGCALVTFAIKAAGPVALGGRDLPIWFTSIVVLLAPALLAALVASQALADGDELTIGADTAGVAAGGLAAWRTGSIILCVLLAPAVTAALRAL